MTLHTEINDQPTVLRDLLNNGWPHIQQAAADIRRNQIAYVALAARGTSAHAGYYAQYLWGAYNRLTVAMASPSLFTRYGTPPDLRSALVLGISQSGQSPDIVDVVAEGARQGALTMAITNDPASPLAFAAGRTLPIRAGAEVAVAATKTYTAQLMTVAMLSVALHDPDGSRRAALLAVPDAVEAVLALEGSLRAAARRFSSIERALVIGRGYNFATTLEWALKLKELSYVAADPYSSAEFQHGPAALVEPGLPALAIAPRDAVADDVRSVLVRLADRGARLLVISDDPSALELAECGVLLPSGVADWLSPIVAIVAAQLFCYHLTLAKGLDPQTPRGLRKVTITH